MGKDTNFKDVAGRPIRVGDRVACIGCYKEQYVGEVVGFTKCMVKVTYLDKYGEHVYFNRYSHQVSKINEYLRFDDLKDLFPKVSSRPLEGGKGPWFDSDGITVGCMDISLTEEILAPNRVILSTDLPKEMSPTQARSLSGCLLAAADEAERLNLASIKDKMEEK